MGTYEQAGQPWSERDAVGLQHELLPDDLDRFEPSSRSASSISLPSAAGIKKVVNGPFTFAPDGNPLVGPVRGLRQFLGRLRRDGRIRQGGGVGLALSSWMIDGDPGSDIWAMDVARYGALATPAYTNVKVQENYRRRFSIRFPNEELPAARPLRRTPVYDRLQAQGAVFGVNFRP